MRRLRNAEEGFSLTELMVVVLIIGILVGVGLPTYLGMRRRAQEVAAKDSVTLALKVAKSFAVDDEETFADVTSASLTASEPSMRFVDGDQPSTGPMTVSQLVPDAGSGGEIFVATAQSQSGTCFFVRGFAHGGADFGRVDGVDCRAGDHGSVNFHPSW